MGHPPLIPNVSCFPSQGAAATTLQAQPDGSPVNAEAVRALIERYEELRSDQTGPDAALVYAELAQTLGDFRTSKNNSTSDHIRDTDRVVAAAAAALEPYATPSLKAPAPVKTLSTGKADATRAAASTEDVAVVSVPMEGETVAAAAASPGTQVSFMVIDDSALSRRMAARVLCARLGLRVALAQACHRRRHCARACESTPER